MTETTDLTESKVVMRSRMHSLILVLLLCLPACSEDPAPAPAPPPRPIPRVTLQDWGTASNPKIPEPELVATQDIIDLTLKYFKISNAEPKQIPPDFTANEISTGTVETALQQYLTEMRKTSKNIETRPEINVIQVNDIRLDTSPAQAKVKACTLVWSAEVSATGKIQKETKKANTLELDVKKQGKTWLVSKAVYTKNWSNNCHYQETDKILAKE